MVSVLAVNRCRLVASIDSRPTRMLPGLSEFLRRCQCAAVDLGSTAVTGGVNVVRECSDCDPNYSMASSLFFVSGHVASKCGIFRIGAATVHDPAGKVWSGVSTGTR